MMKLTAFMYLYETFYSTKNWGVTHWAQEGANRKPLKICLKTGFLTEFPPFLDSTMKVVTYIIHYLVLLYWSTFQAYLPPHFVELWARNALKSSQKSYFSFFGNISNLKTRELQITYTSKLPQIRTTSIPFLYQEMRM